MIVYTEMCMYGNGRYLVEIKLADNSYFSKVFPDLRAAENALEVFKKQIKGVIIARGFEEGEE